MTAKGLFWIFVGPALWTAILLLMASDTAHGVMQIAESAAVPGPRRVIGVPDRVLRINALATPERAQPTCIPTALRRFALPVTPPAPPFRSY